MDDDALNTRNWGYYEASFRGHLGLHLMPTLADRNAKSFLPGRENALMASANGGYHLLPRECVVSDASLIPMDCMRNSWANQRDTKYLNILTGNPYNPNLPEVSARHQFQMLPPPDPPKDDRVVKIEEVNTKKESRPGKRKAGSGAPKAPKTKKTKKNSGMPKENGGAPGQRVKQTKKNLDVIINGVNMDISVMPTPVCSCTGAPQQCYRWGSGGWQSACCTTTVSMHPLPPSTKRRGARIAGRKMSHGAFKKILEKLVSEGYDFSSPIDLRNHWAKHGTNKFVTIR